MRCSDGEEVGCRKATARKNDKCTGRFKVRRMKSDFPEEDQQKADWTTPVMS